MEMMSPDSEKYFGLGASRPGAGAVTAEVEEGSIEAGKISVFFTGLDQASIDSSLRDRTISY